MKTTFASDDDIMSSGKSTASAKSSSPQRLSSVASFMNEDILARSKSWRWNRTTSGTPGAMATVRRRGSRMRRHALVFVLSATTVVSWNDGGASSIVLTASAAPLPNGADSCPCLTAENLKPADFFVNATDILGTGTNFTTYGLGCRAHDVGTKSCTPAFSDPGCHGSIVPRPESCDRSWCGKEWCYVDAKACRLSHEQSQLFPWSDQHYSYATCGNMDRYVNEERMKLLKGQTYKVGYNANSGGWKGAYNPDGHFVADGGWTGPMVDFFDRAAFEGGFRIQRSAPPDFLAEQSAEFFSSSSFDACVYATSLGYLDFCVSLYTISNQRAAAATFFTMISEPVYLVAFDDDGGSWNSFWSNAGNVFKPFTPQTWMLVVFGVIPIMSFLISFHEQGRKNNRASISSSGADPAAAAAHPPKPLKNVADSPRRVTDSTVKEPSHVSDIMDDTESASDQGQGHQHGDAGADVNVDIGNRQTSSIFVGEISSAIPAIPSEVDDFSQDGKRGQDPNSAMHQMVSTLPPTSGSPHRHETRGHYCSLPSCDPDHHIVESVGGSLFLGYNAFFQQAYLREGTTVGGRITVLGIGFFILTIVASYTANLAAILTENARTSRIESLDDAIRAGYRFCGERKSVETIMNLYRISDRFVPDPYDGEPGFNCCKARSRTIDYMKQNHGDGSLYCDAAIVTLEDLEQIQAEGLHCNKTVIGLPLGFSDVGIPIYEGISEEMTTFLQGLKNQGVFQTILKGARPSSQCPEKVEDVGMSLTIMQLSGVWVITFSFAAAGLLAKLIGSCYDCRHRGRGDGVAVPRFRCHDGGLLAKR